MDDKTHFALTIILAFAIGILFGTGNRVVAESNGKKTKTGNNQLIDLILMLFWLMALGYILAILWHVKPLSLMLVIIIASALFGANAGSKLALKRNQIDVRIFLVCSGIGIPLIFHAVL